MNFSIEGLGCSKYIKICSYSQYWHIIYDMIFNANTLCT